MIMSRLLLPIIQSRASIEHTFGRVGLFRASSAALQKLTVLERRQQSRAETMLIKQCQIIPGDTCDDKLSDWTIPRVLTRGDLAAAARAPGQDLVLALKEGASGALPTVFNSRGFLEPTDG